MIFNWEKPVHANNPGSLTPQITYLNFSHHQAAIFN